ncbi:glycoside hydrolase domain-containing protein [Kribbella sp. CA-253562]|uniref:glycoside hydrolase domain-containing protein n=1 Tax=Kribbella sp. CA-253562 TaxID=3239942 RepID=UPI003D8E017A
MGEQVDGNLSRRNVLRLMGAAGAGTAVAAAAGEATAAPLEAAAVQTPAPVGPMADSAIGSPVAAPPLTELRGEQRLFHANSWGRGLLAEQVDVWVLKAQEWVNRAYDGRPGFVRAPEDGKTGWPTMFALTRALQLELGLTGTQLSDTFGPTTLSLLASQVGEVKAGSPANIIRIVQCGLYCKGYFGEAISGTFGQPTGDSIGSIRANMGFTDGRRTLAPKEFKALLTMDAYVVVENGSALIRSVQQWMNRKYYAQSWFNIIPCDGHSSRDVQKAVIYALQTELGVAGANGTYGPGTRAAVKAKAPLAVGAADSGAAAYVRLFQAVMIFNRYETAFDGVFSQAVSDQVRSFQLFVTLPLTGKGDYQTWSSLLVSNGDPERKGDACDCITQVTAARATALFQAGYRVVGRYLSNVPGSTLDKKIKPGELATIFGAGMRVFPIYQTYGGSASYFSEQQGARDASLALEAASDYGFERGTTVYFAVDFDALNTDITNRIIPHFRGIKRAMELYGHPYKIGAYGARNVCSRLFSDGLASTSFVSDMSTGFSGNLGFPMPLNWAFDQISTITVGSGTGAIEIDNNLYSGRDFGQSTVNVRPAKLDTFFDPSHRPGMDHDFVEYSKSVTSNQDNLLHNESEAIDVIVAYDEQITNLARSYGVRKAFVQSEIYWEFWKQSLEDPIKDSLVLAFYAYMHAHEAWMENPIGPAPTPPLGGAEDCSTGIAQIFAATAIRGRNWAYNEGLIPGPPLNGEDWHVVEQVWNSLHDDGTYNVASVPLVLFEGAENVGITGRRLDYTDDELKAIFARYNGSGEGAQMHGREVFGVYQIFESYNARLR